MGQCKKDEMEQEDKSLSCDICNQCGERVPHDELDIFSKKGCCGDCAVRIGLEDS